jgi:hypothetical protein
MGEITRILFWRIAAMVLAYYIFIPQYYFTYYFNDKVMATQINYSHFITGQRGIYVVEGFHNQANIPENALELKLQICEQFNLLFAKKDKSPIINCYFTDECFEIKKLPNHMRLFRVSESEYKKMKANRGFMEIKYYEEINE